MAVTKKSFGTTKDGKEASLYSIKNSKGTEAVITDFGGILVSLFVKNDKGEVKDVVLGYDNLKDYEENPCFFGGIVGPCANRVGGSKCVIDGVEYKLCQNDGVNNLHSDFAKGLHKQLWKAETLENGVKLSFEMADLFVGFPGNSKYTVTYTLSEDNELKIEYEGVSDKSTVFNLTNHSYFALGGHKAGKKGLVDTTLTLKASKFTEIDCGAIPTGTLADVKGTPMDFTSPKKIGKEIEADWKQMTMVKGYDHNYCVDGYNGKLQKIAEASYDGRTMEVYSDLPGFQFYTGNWIDSIDGKEGAKYEERGGFCLETQYYPNSVNEPSFESPIKNAGERYNSTTVYKFI